MPQVHVLHLTVIKSRPRAGCMSANQLLRTMFGKQLHMRCEANKPPDVCNQHRAAGSSQSHAGAHVYVQRTS